MKIGFLGKQNAFALEMLRRLQLDHSRDDFSPWQPGEEAPSTELEVIIAFDRVASTEIEGQAKLDPQFVYVSNVKARAIRSAVGIATDLAYAIGFPALLTMEVLVRFTQRLAYHFLRRSLL
jgi:hypothetical protein